MRQVRTARRQEYITQHQDFDKTGMILAVEHQNCDILQDYYRTTTYYRITTGLLQGYDILQDHYRFTTGL